MEGVKQDCIASVFPHHPPSTFARRGCSQRFDRISFGFYGPAERSARTFAGSLVYAGPAASDRWRLRVGAGRAEPETGRPTDLASEDGSQPVEFFLADCSLFVQCSIVGQLVAGDSGFSPFSGSTGGPLQSPGRP